MPLISLAGLFASGCGSSTTFPHRDAATPRDAAADHRDAGSEEDAVALASDGAPDAVRGGDTADSDLAGANTPDGALADARVDAQADAGADVTVDRPVINAFDAPSVDGGLVRDTSTLDEADGSTTSLDASSRTDSTSHLDVGRWDAVGQCNSLVNDGPMHDTVYASGPSPAATGGTIEDGLYYEIASEMFGMGQPPGPVGERRRLTMFISGQTVQSVLWSDTDGDITETVQMTIRDPVAGVMEITKTCPSYSDPVVFGYSFSGSGPGAVFKLIYPASPVPVLTLMRQ